MKKGRCWVVVCGFGIEEVSRVRRSRGVAVRRDIAKQVRAPAPWVRLRCAAEELVGVDSTMLGLSRVLIICARSDCCDRSRGEFGSEEARDVIREKSMMVRRSPCSQMGLASLQC